jgi:hypothetical protein
VEGLWKSCSVHARGRRGPLYSRWKSSEEQGEPSPYVQTIDNGTPGPPPVLVPNRAVCCALRSGDGARLSAVISELVSTPGAKSGERAIQSSAPRLMWRIMGWGCAARPGPAQRRFRQQCKANNLTCMASWLHTGYAGLVGPRFNGGQIWPDWIIERGAAGAA